MSLHFRGPIGRVARVGVVLTLLAATAVVAQTTKRYSWTGLGGNAQHSGTSLNASQNLTKIFWSKPVDLAPQYSGNDLLIHYGSPLCTASNNLLIPVKVGAGDGFKVEARRGLDGLLKWSMDTDYHVPPHGWFPSMGITLNTGSILFIPAAGGTLFYRKAVDALTGTTGRLAFFGMANYSNDPAAYNGNIFINTPLTSDKSGNIYFGFWATGDTPIHLKSGLARITPAGVGTWIAASTAANDANISKVVTNCAPAISNDGLTVYVTVHTGNWGGGYLVGLDTKTLKPKYKVPLMDWRTPANFAYLLDDGTASPTVGPDGDVYIGVLENAFASNHDRGWLLHFNSTLTVQKATGDFGWDDTAAIVPASAVPSYVGASTYLLMTKYNNYAGIGGDGINKIAILDPNDTQVDPQTGITVMKEVITAIGQTPDANNIGSYPNAVREWCINSAAVDPANKCVFANSEDGKLYRWNLVTNTLDQVVTLTSGIGEAYTPTIIGSDGRVYAINNATLYCVGTK